MVTSAGPHRVVVVDDDPDVLETMADLVRLALPDAQVVTAGDPQRALDDLDHPDLLVTDYRMPGMSGVELARAVLKRRPDLPVLLVTAFPDAAVMEEANRAGIDDMLAKPFTVSAFVQRVRTAVGVT